jgi:hypothetical protein
MREEGGGAALEELGSSERFAVTHRVLELTEGFTV